MATPEPCRDSGLPQHILDAMATRTLCFPVRPLPVPVPRSRSFTQRPPPLPRRWEPKCNHSTMARLYHGAYKCQQCHRTGHFGWLYRCTVDREALILGDKDSDRPVRCARSIRLRGAC